VRSSFRSSRVSGRTPRTSATSSSASSSRSQRPRQPPSAADSRWPTASFLRQVANRESHDNVYQALRDTCFTDRADARSRILVYFPTLYTCWYSFDHAIADYLSLGAGKRSSSRIANLQKYVDSDFANSYVDTNAPDGCKPLARLPQPCRTGSGTSRRSRWKALAFPARTKEVRQSSETPTRSWPRRWTLRWSESRHDRQGARARLQPRDLQALSRVQERHSRRCWPRLPHGGSSREPNRAERTTVSICTPWVGGCLCLPSKSYEFWMQHETPILASAGTTAGDQHRHGAARALRHLGGHHTASAISRVPSRRRPVSASGGRPTALDPDRVEAPTPERWCASLS
jgi:hypothetical protein